jgi:hypothetical protein
VANEALARNGVFCTSVPWLGEEPEYSSACIAAEEAGLFSTRTLSVRG